MSQTATREQVANKEWIDNLTLCLCGNEVTELDSTTHEGCIISGIGRKVFADKRGWVEYCKKNGQRIAGYYRSGNCQHHGNNQ